VTRCLAFAVERQQRKLNRIYAQYGGEQKVKADLEEMKRDFERSVRERKRRGQTSNLAPALFDCSEYWQ
jgi:hypothetical protein